MKVRFLAVPADDKGCLIRENGMLLFADPERQLVAFQLLSDVMYRHHCGGIMAVCSALPVQAVYKAFFVRALELHPVKFLAVHLLWTQCVEDRLGDDDLLGAGYLGDEGRVINGIAKDIIFIAQGIAVGHADANGLKCWVSSAQLLQ